VLLDKHSLIMTGKLDSISIPQACLSLKDKAKRKAAKLFLADCIDKGDLDATLVLCDYFISSYKP
jgi:hypothetical protein